MKRITTLLVSLSVLFALPSCSKKGLTIDINVLKNEIKNCYNYFMDTTNFTSDSNGYGLTQDRLTNSVSSIAATGFLIASYPVFVEEGLIEKETAKNIVDKTFDTVLRMQADEETSYEGCISHFVNKSTAKRSGTSEVSTIDTAILVSGALTAAQYFKGDLITKANTIWGNVDYTKFNTKKNNRDCISMGVKSPTDHTQLSPWDYYAEQLMIYILGVGNPVPEHRISNQYYKNITKNYGEYGGQRYVYSWFGSLFTYQYSQAFFNFKRYNDYRGINWYDNSVKASKAAHQFCIDNRSKYATFASGAWGLTACDAPLGYNGNLGTPPRGYTPDANYYKEEGTVAPTAAVGSMPFTPNESYEAINYFISNPRINTAKYGYIDSFNLNFYGGEWYDQDYIGIDKGIEVLQLYNYINTDFVSNLAMNNPYVIEGFVRNEFVEVVNG